MRLRVLHEPSFPDLLHQAFRDRVQVHVQRRVLLVVFAVALDRHGVQQHVQQQLQRGVLVAGQDDCDERPRAPPYSSA